MSWRTPISGAVLALVACVPLAFAQDAGQSQGQSSPPPQQSQGQMGMPQGRRPVGPQGRGGWQSGPQGRMGGGMGQGMWHHKQQWRRGSRDGFRGGRGGWGMGRGHGMSMGRGAGMPLERLVNNPNLRQQLGITDAQVAKFRQEQESFQKANIQHRATLEIQRMELGDLLRADTPDRAAIDQKLAQLNATQAAMEKARIDNLLAMRAVLTPEQQAKLKQLRQSQPRMGPRGPMGPGGRGGPGQQRPPQQP
jgi:Spy/CpxP family protein refolding chaperone